MTLFLQFDEQDVRRRRADVFATVGLRIEPAHLSRREADIAALATFGDKSPVERGERVHEAVGMLMFPER
jgi:hypothetical protein